MRKHRWIFTSDGNTEEIGAHQGAAHTWEANTVEMIAHQGAAHTWQAKRRTVSYPREAQIGDMISPEAEFVDESGIKYYECEHCQRRFASRKDLKRHMRTHTGEKPYKCYVCDKGFSQKNNMIRHLNRVHVTIKDCPSKI